MNPISRSGGVDELPNLELDDQLDVFVSGAIKGPVRITRELPLTGELIRGDGGVFYLAPEEDYRGGGMGSIRIHDLPPAAMTRFVGKVVKIAGTFEDAKGVTVEAIAAEGKPFEDPRPSDRDKMHSGRTKNLYTGEL